MKGLTVTVLAVVCSVAMQAQQAVPNEIDLSGTWQFCLDPAATVMPTQPMTETVTLPGTTDTNRKGHANENKDETTHLTRLFSYKGRAWYRRTVDIPEGWANRCILLHLERTKPTVVYVDGEKVSGGSEISAEQVHELRSLTPGRHDIAIMVDNGSGVPRQVYASSHAYTEDTQTNWNGIIGRLYLEGIKGMPIRIANLQADAKTKSVAVTVSYDKNAVRKDTRLRLTVRPVDFEGPTVTRDYSPYKENKTDSYPTITLSLGDSARLWDEFSPNLYELTVEAVGGKKVTRRFGLVDFQARGQHFFVNGHQTFLRGKHDACVWPLTAHVPMDVESWRDYLYTCQAYGINHVRFHSWCPPEAAFAAADELGVYLQPELPFWGDFDEKDDTLMRFLESEWMAIVNAYAHHPSFRMFAIGNELWGSVSKMADFIGNCRFMAPDKLFTFGSNYYLGYQGVKPGMDYFTTCRVGGEGWGRYDTHTRGSFSFADAADGGLINHCRPNTVMNFRQGCERAFPEGADKEQAVPVISHETGQFQTYPDYDEIKKYSGVLYPYNLQTFRQRLQQAGMLSQTKAFRQASGLWSLELYKQDIEMDLRTPNMAGFQLLDLQDYPGQGSAYVGILDAFMQPKGLCTERQWRQWCAPVVPLLIADSLCVSNRDGLHAKILVANYSGESLSGKTLRWQLGHQGGTMVLPDGEGLLDVGMINADLAVYDKPTQLELLLAVNDTEYYGVPYHNTYDLWCYPSENRLDVQKQGIIITRQMTDEIGKKLSRGARVLLMPDSASIAANSVGPLFTTDYWNYRMFKTIAENNKKSVSPGTLGLLCNPQHPLFREFPTQMHTNWQWFPVIKHSRPLIVDRWPVGQPLVQVIDNIERNHKLALALEYCVGKGRLLIVMSDLELAATHIEGRQFYSSVLSYMHSSDFNPTTSLTMPELQALLSAKADEKVLQKLNNISPY